MGARGGARDSVSSSSSTMTTTTTTTTRDDPPDDGEGGEDDDEGARARPVPRVVTRRVREWAEDVEEEVVEEDAIVVKNVEEDARVRRWRSNLATRGVRSSPRIAATAAVGAPPSSSSSSSAASAPFVPPRSTQQQQQAREFGLEEVFARVLLPANAAAQSLGVSETTFKLRTRELGMHRWPYRKFQGVIECYEYVSRVLKELVDEFSTQVTDMDEEQRRVFAREKNQEFMRLKAASEELTRDLDSMEKYATGLRERFLRMGCVCDECTVNNAAALDFNKIRRKVYKHRMMLANYTKDIIKNTLK